MLQPRSIVSDFLNAGRGLLMGGADIIPGVSGGTVALLLGIYPQLVTAISNIDGEFLRLVVGREWSKAASHIDLRFLVALAVGILAGILTLAGVIHYLLDHHRAETLAGFFGLILASSILVARMAEPTPGEQRARCIFLGLVAVALAAWLVSGSHLQSSDSRSYVFVCGAIAICAMILPGISGAYILVLLGLYEPITDILHRLKALDISVGDGVTLAVFALGCVVGLLAFSKLLRALLARFHSETMSVLGGFMIGSLLKVWPFQQSDIPGEELTKTSVTHPVLPQAFDQQVVACAVIATVAFAAVMLIDRVARRSNRATHSADE